MYESSQNTQELLSTVTQPILTVVAVAPERCPPFPSLVSRSPHWGRTVQTASSPAVCLSQTPAPQNSSGGRWASANVYYIDYLYACSGSQGLFQLFAQAKAKGRQMPSLPPPERNPGSLVTMVPVLVSYSKIPVYSHPAAFLPGPALLYCCLQHGREFLQYCKWWRELENKVSFECEA